MHWIYISPHFDDAVLSCGGLIWEQTHSGTPVEIWTVFAGYPPTDTLSEFAAGIHAKWQTGSGKETVALRREEDAHAARLLGATVKHFPVADCIYRVSKQGNPLYDESVFVEPNLREAHLADEITHLLSQSLNAADTVVCPLAIGGHVDHVITRVAAEKLRRPLWYYADVPYIFRHPDDLHSTLYNKRSKSCFISPAGLRAWQEAVAAYASQIPMLFPSTAAMRQALRDYMARNSGLDLYRAE